MPVRLLLTLLFMAGMAREATGAARAGDYIGINQWVDGWDNVTMRCADTPKIAHWIRWYTYMGWNTEEPGVFHFAPTLAGGGPNPNWAGFDFDDWFGTWHRAGLKVNLSLFQSAAYCSSHQANGNEGGEFQKYPPCGTTPGFKAGDYREFAGWVYQLVARYGRQAVDRSTLLTGDKQSGLGYVDAVEIWNEPNLTQAWGPWRHDTCPRTHGSWCDKDVAQYTACLKASFTVARQADPRLPVTGGVTAGFDEPYFDGIRTRGGLGAMDGINVHCYLGTEGTAGPGHAPEYRNGFKAYCENVTRWRDAHAPRKPIWLTEFGYDAHDEKERPPTFIGATLQEQANYLIRAYVIGAEYLDRFFWFIAADSERELAKQQFANCGIVHAYSEKNPGGDPSVVPKTSYWYMATMKQEIGNQDYAATLKYDEDGVFAYLFKDPASSAGTVVAWCADPGQKTDSGVAKAGYVMALPGMPRTCVQVTPREGSYHGTRRSLAVRSSHITCDLSETPIFLEFDRVE